VIQRCNPKEFDKIQSIINDGAKAYKGVIPDDRWAEPYMSTAKLQSEIHSGVEFWGYQDGESLAGVMGVQHVQDVVLIRHAYVRSTCQQRGIGSKLLVHLRSQTSKPMLIGTWADAHWAISFYQRHGFQRVEAEEKNRLLRKYWNIPERQVETSVVLADEHWIRLRLQSADQAGSL
jgi:N-acetylglutamate synthase-like GNAT family acetyltransferase